MYVCHAAWSILEDQNVMQLLHKTPAVSVYRDIVSHFIFIFLGCINACNKSENEKALQYWDGGVGRSLETTSMHAL